MRLGLTRLRWITIGVAVAALAVLMHVMTFVLPGVFRTPAGYIAAEALVLLAVVAFSHVVFLAIERLQDRITRQNARLQAAARVSAVLSESGEQGEMMGRVLDGICDPLDADAGVIRLIDARTGAYAVTTRGLSADEAPALRLIPPALDGASLVDDTALQPRFSEIARHPGFRSLLLAPLVAHGSAEGTLVLASRQPRRFSEEDRQLLEQVARQIGLAAQRSSLLAELVDRNKELCILNDHSAALSLSHALPDVLDVVLRTLVEVSASQDGEFWLEEGGTLELVHRIEAGVPGPEPEALERPIRLTRADRSEQIARARRSGVSSFEKNKGAIHACLPVRAGGRVSGVIHLVRPLPNRWSQRRQRLFETIADQGSVAVSDAQQRGRTREVAVLEERGRIAREMHDGLAQILGYLNTKSSAIRLSLDHGDAAAASAMLAELEEAAHDASTDVRESVLALRSTDPGDRDLFGNLSVYIEKFQRMSGIRVDCHLSVDCAALQLSEVVGLHVIRLIQESLSNVRKHSGVKRAMVSITAAGDALDIHIDDEGHGFDVELVGLSDRQSFGLGVMRERAEAVGGRFSVTSAPGEGTHVHALMPIGRPALDGA